MEFGGTEPEPQESLLALRGAVGEEGRAFGALELVEFVEELGSEGAEGIGFELQGMGLHERDQGVKDQEIKAEGGGKKEEYTQFHVFYRGVVLAWFGTTEKVGSGWVEKPRVRVTSSDAVVGLENDDHFADTGSRGDSPLRGAGFQPHKINGQSPTVVHEEPRLETEKVPTPQDQRVESDRADGV